VELAAARCEAVPGDSAAAARCEVVVVVAVAGNEMEAYAAYGNGVMGMPAVHPFHFAITSTACFAHVHALTLAGGAPGGRRTQLIKSCCFVFVFLLTTSTATVL